MCNTGREIMRKADRKGKDVRRSHADRPIPKEGIAVQLTNGGDSVSCPVWMPESVPGQIFSSGYHTGPILHRF